MTKLLKCLMLISVMVMPALKAEAVVPTSSLDVDNGWYIFNAGGTGSEWDRAYSFSLSSSAILTVTDVFLSGDRYEVIDLNSSTLGLTSIPTSIGDQIFADFDAALSDPRWSSGQFPLSAGSYLIHGRVESSPFTNSAGGLRVDTTSTAVPEPATVLLLAIGVSVAGLQRRMKKKASVI